MRAEDGGSNVWALAAVANGCAPQCAVDLPVDHAGFLERWRRACELGKAGAACGMRVERDAAPSDDEPDGESEGSAEHGDINAS